LKHTKLLIKWNIICLLKWTEKLGGGQASGEDQKVRGKLSKLTSKKEKRKKEVIRP
jgi:hypothetical protein